MTNNQTIVYKVVRVDEDHIDEKGIYNLFHLSLKILCFNL